MKPKSLKPVAVFLFLTAAVLASSGRGFSQTIDCEGTRKAWGADKSLSAYMQAYTCTCPSKKGQPVCVKNMTDTPTKGGSKSGKINFEKQVAAAVVGSLLTAVFTFDTSSDANEKARQEQLRQQEELERQALEIKKQGAVQQWKALQMEEVLRKERETQQRQKAGQELLVRMGAARGGLSGFKWEKSQESELQYKPVEAPLYPAKSSQWERLLCAAYFSSNALKATRGGNVEHASYLNEQADKAMAGQSTTLECKLPAVPVPPDPRGAENLTTALTAIRTSVQSLQGTETKLTDVKERLKTADGKKEAAKVRLQEAQTFATAAQPDRKAEADTLLAEALAALEESEKELVDAKQSEEELLRKKEKTENEIRDIDRKLASDAEN